MRREGGVGSGFYRPGGVRNKEGKQGGARHLPNGAGDFPSVTRHGRAKEGSSGKKKGKRKGR